MICSGGSRGGLRGFATFENAEKEKKRERKEEKKSEFKSAKKYSTGECFGGICTYEWNALKCHMLISGFFLWMVVIDPRYLMFIDVQYLITIVLIGSLAMKLLILKTVIFS